VTRHLRLSITLVILSVLPKCQYYIRFMIDDHNTVDGIEKNVKK